MLNIDLRDTFLHNHAQNCTFNQLYKLFQYYYANYSRGDSHAPVEVFGDALCYLKKLVTIHSPQECIRRIYKIEGWHFKAEFVEPNYIYLMHTITLIHLYYDDYQFVSHWSKKTSKMIDYFHPCLNEMTKKNIIQKNRHYKDALNLSEEYKSYLDPEVDKDFLLDWERKFYLPKSHANQNFRHRIYT